MKKRRYAKQHEELAKKFGALSHPARVKLVLDLMEKEYCVGEMQRSLAISQPNVSQHLKILKEAGIIRGRREKTTICYKIADNKVRDALLLFLKGEGTNESDL